MTLLDEITDLGLNLPAASFVRDGDRLTRTFEIAGTSYASAMEAPDDTGDDLGDWWRALLTGQQPKALESRGRIRSLDLFCGPGGLALGFGQAARELGYEVVSEAAVDEDTGAVDVYSANHHTRRRVKGSVRALVDYQVRETKNGVRFRYDPEIIAEEFEDLPGRVDVVLAGPPCQGHSNLNNHTRRTDRRNELYLTVPAFAVAVGASMVVIENVPAVIHDRQRVVSKTKQLLEHAGYQVTTGRFMADRLGWPQARQRFFLLARKDVHPLAPDALQRVLASETRSLWWAIADLEDAPIDDRTVLPVELSEENARRISWLFENDEYDLPLSERPECHRDGTTYNSVYGRLNRDRPAPTITSGFMTPGRGRYIHPTRRRTLSAREAARLQGFPDSYDFTPNGPSSKAQLGKWIGDAVPMPLGHAAGLATLGPSPFIA